MSDRPFMIKTSLARVFRVFDGAALAIFLTSSTIAADSAVDWKSEGDLAVKLLQQYIRIDTSNAPGVAGASGDVREAAGFLEKHLREEGIETRRIAHPKDPTREFLIGRVKGDGSLGKAMIIEHHMDVVPAEGKWTHPPFGGEIHAGFLYGRGAMDD